MSVNIGRASKKRNRVYVVEIRILKRWHAYSFGFDIRAARSKMREDRSLCPGRNFRIVRYEATK